MASSDVYLGLRFKRILYAECYSDLFQLSDAKLQTEDGYTFDIHRIILARNSDYFRAMFCGIGKDRREFMIPGISGWCLCEILSYVYTSDISITEQNVADLLIAADYLLLTDLYEVIKGRIKDTLTTVNCLRLYRASYDVNDEIISSQSFRLIQTRFETVVLSLKNELVDLPIVFLENILSDRSLCVVDESSIWQTMIEWTKKDLNKRLKHFPRLLILLARKELDEKLASEILHHEIVDKIDFFQTGKGKTFSSDLEVVQSFLKNHGGRMDFRIPAYLYVIAAQTTENERSILYVTYDEKLDLWRRIGEIDFLPDYMIPVENYIIFFSITEGECLKFDLINQQWTPMTTSFRNNIYCVVEINDKVFVLGTVNYSVEHWTFGFEVYDTKRDIWYDGVPLEDIRNALAVAVSRTIYVIGNKVESDMMAAFAFDVDDWKWRLVPPPNFFRTTFALVAFHDNVYLIGGSNNIGDVSKVEVFFTATATWQELPELPHTYLWVHAMIWEDQIIVFDDDEVGCNATKKDIRWDEENYCWESPLINFHNRRICELNNVNAVKSVSRKNRNPEAKLERSCFSL